MSAPRRCNDNWSWVHVQLLAGPPQHVHQSKSSPSKAGYITEKEALKSFIECVRERRVGGWWYQILEELLLFSKPTCANCISSAIRWCLDTPCHLEASLQGTFISKRCMSSRCAAAPAGRSLAWEETDGDRALEHSRA